MLVLSRKTGQQIAIGGGISVTILGVRRGRVRIGVTAPPGVEVRRGPVGCPKRADGEAAEACARQAGLVTLNKMAAEEVASDRRRKQVVGRW